MLWLGFEATTLGLPDRSPNNLDTYLQFLDDSTILYTPFNAFMVIEATFISFNLDTVLPNAHTHSTHFQ